MYSKKVKLRFIFIVVFLTLIVLTTFIVLKVLKDNVIYFKSPSVINLQSNISKKKIRVGGMVKKDSVIMKTFFLIIRIGWIMRLESSLLMNLLEFILKNIGLVILKN